VLLDPNFYWHPVGAWLVGVRFTPMRARRLTAKTRRRSTSAHGAGGAFPEPAKDARRTARRPSSTCLYLHDRRLRIHVQEPVPQGSGQVDRSWDYAEEPLRWRIVRPEPWHVGLDSPSPHKLQRTSWRPHSLFHGCRRDENAFRRCRRIRTISREYERPRSSAICSATRHPPKTVLGRLCHGCSPDRRTSGTRGESERVSYCVERRMWTRSGHWPYLLVRRGRGGTRISDGSADPLRPTLPL